MYDELVKRLREVEEMLKVAQFKEAANLIGQAADAIEELIAATASNEIIAKNNPQWISAKEPPKEET